MDFRATSGEKNFRIFLLAQKKRRQISGGHLGVVLIFDFIFWSKSPKLPSCLVKNKKGATVKMMSGIDREILKDAISRADF